MARPPEQRQAVRAAYVFDRLPLEQAAAKAAVPHGTARKWRAAAEAQGDDWDKARAAASLSAQSTGTIAQLVLADFLVLYQATVGDLNGDAQVPAMDRAEALARLADAFAKTMHAVAKASPEMARYAVASELLRDLAAWTRAERPDLQAAILEILEPFGAWIARTYG